MMASLLLPMLVLLLVIGFPASSMVLFGRRVLRFQHFSQVSDLLLLQGRDTIAGSPPFVWATFPKQRVRPFFSRCGRILRELSHQVPSKSHHALVLVRSGCTPGVLSLSGSALWLNLLLLLLLRRDIGSR